MRCDRFACCWLVLAVLLSSGGTALAGEAKTDGAWLGVRLSAGSPSGEGVRLARIFNDSAAAKAGLRASDILLTFDGVEVTGSKDLIGQIKSHDPGSWVPLTVVRDGDELEMRVRLGDRPAKIRVNDVRRGWIGVEAIELPKALREHFGAPAEAGVMISKVAEASPAEAAGFELGDVVYEVDERPVRSVGALREMVAGGGVGNDCEFSVARAGTLLVLESDLDLAPPVVRKR